MQFQIIHTPIGGIDTDSHDTMMDSVDYRDALNLRNTTTYIGKKSVQSNVKGNVLVSYSLTGRHKCIGSYEDKKDRSVIYFLWAKSNEHKILRYYPEKVSNSAPYGVIEHIITYDFGWKEMTKITSVDLVNGELLYWTDPKPRKINVVKANLTEKRKTWKIIYPTNYNTALVAGALLVSVVNRVTGVSVLSDTTFSFAANTPRATVLSTFTTYINATFSAYVTAELCDDCSIELTENSVGDCNFTIVGAPPFLVIAENWYGNSPALAGFGLADKTFDRIKYPPVYQPTCEHAQDLVKNYNYIKGKVFQFRTQFHYDDNEQSKLSPISQISINNTANLSEENLYNYIKVNVNNNIFSNVNLTLIKRVSILFREGNFGVWKKIDEFDICQIYDYSGSAVRLLYNFYNNISSSGISDILASSQYDKVPIEAQASNFVEGRIVDANITDDYDVERCIDASVQVTIDNAVQDEYVTLYGYIKIHSYRMNDSSFRSAASPDDYPFYSFPYQEPQAGKLRGLITHDTTNASNFPTFGGAMYGYQDGWDFGITENIAEQWGQSLPEGGFPVYSAGTDFLTISRQIEVGGLTTTDAGGLDISSASKIAQIGTYFSNVNNQCYSIFSLRVPKAKQVIRIASHLCSFDDKLGLGDCYNLSNNSYQKTSTYVNGYFNSSGSWIGGTKEIYVDATAMSGDNYIGCFVIQDLCPSYDELPADPAYTNPSIIVDNSTYYYAWKNIVGYLYCDDSGSVNPNDAGYDGIPVTGAYIRGTVFDNRTLGNAIYDERLDSFTDHNGFFFMTFMRHDNDKDESALYLSAFQVTPLTNAPYVTGAYGHGVSIPVHYPFYTTVGEAYADYAFVDTFPNSGNCLTIHSFSQNKYAGYLSNLIDKTLTPTFYGFDIGVPAPTVVLELYTSGTTNVVLPTDVSGLRTKVGYTISGTVLDGATGIENISIVATGGAVATTNVSGAYSMTVWGNMYSSVTFDTTNGGTFTTAQLDPFAVYSHNSDRVVEIIYQKGIYNISAATPTSYSHTLSFATFPTTAITTDNFAATNEANLSEKALKRGGNYIVGIRYYDDGNRSSDVLSDDALKFYIPFITEDLNKYLSNYGAPNTYRTGIPSVQITINHTPPTWAKTYQILLSQNLNQLNFLQFKVNEVKYIIQSGSDGVPEITTNELTSSVTQLKISLNNINDYYRRNNDSNVGWTFNKGDKIRLISNDAGTYYQGLYEFEVISYEAPNWYIIKYNGTDIKTGTLIEIFSQKINLSDQFFYEVGETYPISGGTHGGSPITLTCGDTYWRKRTIPVLNDYFNIYNNYPCTIESNTISDFYDSKYSDIGRIGITDPLYKRTYKKSMVRVSNNFIPNSGINGLSENENVDDIELGVSYGEVMKMEQVGDTIIAVCKNKCVALYLGKVLAQGVESGILATTNEFIGDHRPLIGDFGTLNPESVKSFGNSIYVFDAYRGVVWKYDNNGIDAISYKQNKAYFEAFASELIWETPAIFDSLYNEYILTIELAKSVFVLDANNTMVGMAMTFADSTSFDNLAIDDLIIVEYTKNGQKFKVNGYVTFKGAPCLATLLDDVGTITSDITITFRDKTKPKTIAYSELVRKFTTRYSFTPECYGTAKRELVSFRSGGLWIHDKSSTYNNFYGTQYKSLLTIVANGIKEGYGGLVKLWLAIAIRTQQSNKLFNWDLTTIRNKTQLSRIYKGAFGKKEEYWHSDFKRDLNTLSVTNPIVNGKNLRSQTLEITMENDAVVETNINQIEIIATNSEKNT